MTLLGIHSEKNMTRKDTGIPMFTAALFKLAKHPSIEEWIKMWAIHTMEHHSDIKKSNAMCSNTDGPRVSHRAKSVRGAMSYLFYVESKKT